MATKTPAASRAARNAVKAKKRVRKHAKKYTFSTFETDIFEGEFKLPVMRQMPHTYALALNNGDFTRCIPGWMKWVYRLRISRLLSRWIAKSSRNFLRLGITANWESNSLSQFIYRA